MSIIFRNGRIDLPPIHLSREIGVVGDNKTNTVKFIVPRMKGDIDLYEYSARIDIFPIDETEEPYFETLVVDVPEQDDTTLTLNWLVKRRDTASAGKLYFDICFYEAIENGQDVAVYQTVKDFVIVNDGVTVGAENTLDPTGWELIIEKIIASGGEIGNCSVVDLLSDLYALTGTLGVVKNSYAVTDRVLDFDVEYDYIEVKDAPTLPAISDNIHYKTVTYNNGGIIQLGFDETTDEPYFCFILTIDDVDYLYLYAESAVSGSVALTNLFDSTLIGWSRSLVTTEEGGELTFGDFEAVSAFNIPIIPSVTFTDNITPANSVLINTFFNETEAIGARLYYYDNNTEIWNQVGGSSSGNYTVESVVAGLSWSAEFVGSKFYMTYMEPDYPTLEDLGGISTGAISSDMEADIGSTSKVPSVDAVETYTQAVVEQIISDSFTNKSDLDNVSGTNTGDQDLSGLEPKLPAAPIDPERKVLNGNKQWIEKQSAYIVDDLTALNALTGMAAGDQAIVKHVSRNSNLSASLPNGVGNPNSIYGRVVPKLNVDPIITKPENVSELIDAYITIRQQLLGSTIFADPVFSMTISPDFGEGVVCLVFIDDKDDAHMILYFLDDIIENGEVELQKYTWLETFNTLENVDICNPPKFDFSSVIEATFFNPDENSSWPATPALWDFIETIMSQKPFTNVQFYYDGLNWRERDV